MNRKAGFLVIAAALLGGVAAYYGGWATVTVANLPDQLVAGEPYNMTFSIRQHGERLITDLSPYVELSSGKSQLIARAVPTNKAGYYTATLNVPKSGEWDATIQTSFGKSQLQLMPIAAVATASQRSVSFTAGERGQRLFVAKGCVACHEHGRVSGSGYYKVGPVLTDKRFAPDYLKQFLADPSIKPPTTDARMPKLDLDAAEIGALVAFINAESARRTASTK